MKGKALGKRAVEDVVRVRYNPANPPRSMLDSPRWLALSMTGLCLVSGLGGWLVAIGLSGPSANPIEPDLGLPWPVLLGGGLLLVVGALAALNREARRTRQWQLADGTVVATRSVDSSDAQGSTTHRSATYRFADAAGREHTRHASTWREKRRSETVQVRYDPRDPARSELVSTATRTAWWVASIAGVALGGWMGRRRLHDGRHRLNLPARSRRPDPAAAPNELWAERRWDRGPGPNPW